MGLLVKERATPDTPGTGYSTLYPKVDGQWYFKDDLGAEKQLATALGPFLAADGSAASPAYSFGSTPNTGFFTPSVGTLHWANGGAIGGQLGSGSLSLGSSLDASIIRDAANTLAMRSGASGQSFRLYNTYTDASNYERADIGWSGNEFLIDATFSGTGSARPLVLRTGGTTDIVFRGGGTDRWFIDASAGYHFLAAADNTYDIGASGATRPRDLFLGRNLTVGGNATLGDASGDALTINAGTWTLGADYTASRAAGTMGAGVYIGPTFSWTGTGADAGATTQAQTIRYSSTFHGATDIGIPIGIQNVLTWSSTGTATNVLANYNRIQNSSSGTITRARVFASALLLNATGGIVTAEYYGLDSPTFSSTGAINTLYGYRALNLGNALVTTAVGFKVENFTNSTTMRGLWSSLSAGSGKHNLYIDGTAVNYIAGQIQAGDGSAAAPAYSFSSDIDTGMLLSGGRIEHAIGGASLLGLISNGRLQLTSTGSMSWSSGAIGASSDVLLERDAASVLAQRDGVNAQAFRLYNTFTDASNYERFGIAWGSNIMKIQTEQAGTGAARAMQIGTVGSAALSFYTNNSLRWQFDGAAGHLLAITDNAHDIGASGATRPRIGYFGTSVVAPVASLSAGTTATAPLKVPHGVAPDSPVNGDIWTTTAGLFARINGATVQFATV